MLTQHHGHPIGWALLFRRIHFSAEYALSMETAFPLTHNVTVTEARRCALTPGQGLHIFLLGLLEGTSHMCFLHSGSDGFPVLPIADCHNQCQAGWPVQRQKDHPVHKSQQASHVRLARPHVLQSLQRSDNSDLTSVLPSPGKSAMPPFPRPATVLHRHLPNSRNTLKEKASRG